MEPIPFPSATIEAYGGKRVRVDPPPDFELTDNSPIEPFEGMVVGETTYALIGIHDSEIDALLRTRCFYLGFMSGFIPVFTLRVADIVQGEQVEEVLPVIYKNIDLYQEARDNWYLFSQDIVYKRIPERTRFVEVVGQDERHQDILKATVIETGEYLLHNLATGNCAVVPEEYVDFLFGGKLVREVEEANCTPLQKPRNSSEENPDVQELLDEGGSPTTE